MDKLESAKSKIIPAAKIEQLSWANWSNFCELHSDIVSRENPARKSEEFVNDGGDKAGPPYIEVTITADLSDEGLETIVRHGDYVALLTNGKLRVIRFETAAADMVQLINAQSTYVDPAIALFDFDPEEFPLWSIWTHNNGNQYIITGYNNTTKPQRPNYLTRIEYSNIHTQEKYSGEAWDWHRRMTLTRKAV